MKTPASKKLINEEPYPRIIGVPQPVIPDAINKPKPINIKMIAKNNRNPLVP